VDDPAAFRVHVDQFDDAVQSIGSVRRCPLHRKVTVDLDELGRGERMESVNDLRIEIRMWRATEHGYSVRGNSTSWRNLDRIAGTLVQPRRILVSGIEWIPRPRQWVVFSQLQNRGKCGRFIPGITNLTGAIECAAIDAAKYNRFAARARMESEWDLAKLFQEMADSDRLDSFAKEAKIAGLIASSADNLRNAMETDRKEVTMFNCFARQAREDGDVEIASLFETIERNRVKRYARLEAALGTMGIHSGVWTIDDSRPL
jgi:rubrerythrin